jgi:hypothetical protein
MLEVVEQSQTLMRIQYAETYGWFLLFFFVGYALWGLRHQWRRRRGTGQPLGLAVWVPTGVCVLLGLVFCYFLVTTTEVCVDKARGEVTVRKIRALGIALLRDERLALDELTGVEVITVKPRRSGPRWHLELLRRDGGRLSLQEEYTLDEANANAVAAQLRAFLAGREGEPLPAPAQP